jgi:shikimate kinase
MISLPTPPLIALIGFMGAGKTTVGRILAQKLDYEFIDTDDIIAAEARAAVVDIFRQKGEAAFRRMEADTLQSLVGRSRIVIAAGGGAPIQESNRDFFRISARTIHLRVSMQNVRNRAQAPDAAMRPLLSQGDKAVQRLFDARRPIYETLGQPVETDGRTPKEVADEIISLLADPRGNALQGRDSFGSPPPGSEIADKP